MKKIIGLLCLIICIDLNAAILLTNIPENGGYRLINGNANIKSFKFYSSSPAKLLFYDNYYTAGPIYGTNFSQPSYVSASSSVVTNVVGPYIGPSGYTNYMTNIVLSTSYTTNGNAVGEARRVFEVYIPAATYINVDTDLILTKGLFVHANPATNVSTTIEYQNP